MIKVEGLYKHFQGEKEIVKVINNVGFEVMEGEIFTLLGPRGYGRPPP